MTVDGFSNHMRQEEMKRFMLSALVFLIAAALFVFPAFANAASSFSGQFGPSSDLITNTTNSLQGWWHLIAGWGLYVSLGALAFSIFFAGGKLWWVPVCIILLCLFGEMTVTRVGTMAGFNETTGA